MRNSSHPFAGANKPKYKKNQVLFDGKNGDGAVIAFYKGYYAIRGQGPGGHGGDNNYWNNGGGGGSGAGFEGYVYFSKKVEAVSVGAGVAGDKSTVGTNTYIGDILVLAAGQAGAAGVAGAGGVFQFNPAAELGVKIVNVNIQSNGQDGKFSNAGSPADRCGGGNSVLTNTGAGFGGTEESVKATAPGAGGGGMIQYGAAGGAGMYGELKIVYIGRKMPTT